MTEKQSSSNSEKSKYIKTLQKNLYLKTKSKLEAETLLILINLTNVENNLREIAEIQEQKEEMIQNIERVAIELSFHPKEQHLANEAIR